MNSLVDRLTFAVSVLQEDEEAQMILSDLLEEQGDRALAQWARHKKKNWQKRVDFVMAVVPSHISFKLACDFLGESLGLLDSLKVRSTYAGGRNNASIKPLTESLDILSKWAFEKLMAEQDQVEPKQFDGVENAIGRLGGVGPWQYGIQNIDKITQTLHIAASNFRNLGSLTQNRKEEETIRNACRKVARSSRHLTQPFHIQARHAGDYFQTKDPDFSNGLKNLMKEWYLEHTSNTLLLTLSHLANS